MQKLARWNDLVEEVDLPSDIAAAVSTRRSELLKLCARDMSKNEVKMLLNLVGVLIDTNFELQRHSADLAEKIKQISGNLKGINNSILKLADLAAFKEEVEGEVEDD